MFNKSSFCHIASNNRNDQKGSVFIYKTTDTLAQVTQSGYFNEKLIDINVHDLIIHVQYNPVTRTLKKSVLIVTERTLDNVETAPILDQTIVENIDQLGNQIDRLGDQVAGIEEKIPENASAQNQLATKSEIPTVPTNISAFNNDSGYITSSALTPYATTQALNDGLATKQPAGDYATNSALTSGLALKVAIAQGAENAGKILKIDDSGNVIAADESGGASLPILYHTWSDHILNDVSWLRADTFSWQSGDVYVAAYEHLVGDLDTVQKLYCWLGEKMGHKYYTYSESPSVGETTTDGDAITSIDSYGRPVVGAEYLNRNPDGDILSTQTDTIGDITITYYLAEDGHKICLPDQESNIAALYEATGVAWYYILDTTNRQFKLPRTKWGFTGLRDSVGGYIAPGLPNITGSVTRNLYYDTPTATGSFVQGSTSDTNLRNDGSGEPAGTLSFDASRSSSVYGNSTTVQPPATQMYLYFYVGNFAQSAIEQTAGLNAEMFNDLNAHKVIDFQVPTANDYTWYRKYADGWVEQGGRALVPATNGLSGSSVNVTLLVPIATPEQATLSYNGMGSTGYYSNCGDQASVTTTTVTIGRWNNGSQAAEARYYNWTLSGMSAQ